MVGKGRNCSGKTEGGIGVCSVYLVSHVKNFLFFVVVFVKWHEINRMINNHLTGILISHTALERPIAFIIPKPFKGENA